REISPQRQGREKKIAALRAFVDQLTLPPPSAFRRCFHFKGRKLPDDSCARAFWTLHFPFALALIFHNRISDLESFPAFLALKFISGHSLLPSDKMQKIC